MNRTTAAVLIALAFTAGNIAAPQADTFRLKQNHQKFQLQPSKGPALPSGGQNFQAKPFPANCVAGFQKYDEHKVMKAGVPVVQRFNCRTAWIECPDFPAYAQTWTEYEVEDQGSGDQGKKIRFKYLCQGVDIAG